MEIRDRSTIRCRSCGYKQVSDRHGFFHNKAGIGEELRYVSDWSRRIYADLRERVRQGQVQELSARTAIRMIDYEKHKFVDVGHGTVTLNRDHFRIEGTLRGEPVQLQVPIAMVPSLPFSPGKYLEVQHGEDIYRCVLEDGKLVMKFINLVKIYHELRTA